MLSGRGLCDELITRPEESYRLCCVVCDLETSRIGAPYIYIYIYIYDISIRRVNKLVCLMGFATQKRQETSGEKMLNFASNGQEMQFLLHTVLLLLTNQQ